MLRSAVLRASPQGQHSLLNQHLVRTARPSITCLHVSQQRHQRRNVHAISNPKLAGIEKWWEKTPPQEQAELWMQLRDRMKTDWHDMTLLEKKASYWIAFGPHGPRAVPPPGENWRIFGWTMVGIGVAAVLFVIARLLARPPPRTMTREWQEATNEYLKGQRVEPITGYASEGYTGRGMVQSPSGKK